MGKGKKERRGGFKIPIISTAILVGQAALAWERSGGNALAAAREFALYYTGVSTADGKFNAPALLIGWGPWIAKGFIGKLAHGVGARPKMPFGLPISIS